MEEVPNTPLHLFEGFGIELEYMIVDRDSLNVRPMTDTVLHKLAGDYLTEVNMGRISYSNELALHVLELKTTNPEPSLQGVDSAFHEHITAINKLLEPYNAKLLPTGAHPWMDPYKEMKLWPHEHNPIYEAYDRIFDCKGHGWANLQSMHVNLAFDGDEEFFKLHSAIRILLPILPAIAASSPILDGKVTSIADTRLDVYQRNQIKIPGITGQVIPEVSYSYDHYQKTVLEPIYKLIAPHDPEKILQFEWLNSKGAIARFDRSAIEIRVVDIQECPKADIAIARACVHVLQMLIFEKLVDKKEWLEFPQAVLVDIYKACVQEGERAIISNENYLKLFHLSQPLTAGALWRYLLQELLEKEDHALEMILREGTLSSRIVEAYKRSGDLKKVYTALAECLKNNELFSVRCIR